VAWLDPAAPWAEGIGLLPGGTTLAAALVARVELDFDDTRSGVHVTDRWEAVLHPVGANADWSAAHLVDHDDRDLRPDPPTGARYELPEADVSRAAWFTQARRGLTAHLRRSEHLELARNRKLGLLQRPDEPLAAFAARCDAAAASRADEEADKLRRKLATRRERLEDALDKARDRADALRRDQADARTEDLVDAAGSVLSSLLGGRRSSRQLAREVSRLANRRTRSGTARLEQAEAAATGAIEDLGDLETELAEEILELDQRWRAVAEDVDALRIGLSATDVNVTGLSLVWVPVSRPVPVGSAGG
jgi:hypothetical protein